MWPVFTKSNNAKRTITTLPIRYKLRTIVNLIKYPITLSISFTGVVLHMQVDDSDDEDTETYAQVAWSTTKSFAATIHNGGTKLGKGMRIVTTKAVAVFPSQFLK